jgi:plastocyanin
MRSLRIAAVGVFAAVAMAACSSNDSTSATPTTNNAPAPSTDGGSDSSATTPTTTASGGGSNSEQAAALSGKITIQDFQFGVPLLVKPGATVTVTNQDAADHDVVADDGSFKTALLGKGKSATFTAPTKPGTYTFSCSVHANMTGTGTLVVQT